MPGAMRAISRARNTSGSTASVSHTSATSAVLV